ncbi:Tfp pilus assembly protein FimT/FimU [Luteimonas sp. FCS-9]|uniref:GspH/FimT family pseudopilin n=1 Tax=Luteimonas sp. FCS-9 TaxID=1547516 RepID=UPI00063E7527|nr:Tfp pilus assembly protein FimT/FimU [Luteimonas sp. FCS-9]KLJ01738.1 hypothetical protein WQ56_05620 [Luteimonas sp. FCS-9]
MHRLNGFTLIELLTILVILAVVAMVGLPGFVDLVARHRVQTTMHLIGADLAMARSSAIVGRSPVVVCPADGEAGCRDDGDWSDGWIVFADPDGNRQVDAPADVLRITPAPAGAARGLRIDATRPLVRYQRDGRSAGTNLTVRICRGGHLEGEIVVNNLGRVRSERLSVPMPCPA